MSARNQSDPAERVEALKLLWGDAHPDILRQWRCRREGDRPRRVDPLFWQALSSMGEVYPANQTP